MKLEAWLADLKIPHNNHRLVMLLPMVYVAWADGQIHARERRLILQIAEERGLLENGGRETLERWLSVAPTESQLRTNLALLNTLCSSDRHGTDEFDADCAQTLKGREELERLLLQANAHTLPAQFTCPRVEIERPEAGDAAGRLARAHAAPFRTGLGSQEEAYSARGFCGDWPER